MNDQSRPDSQPGTYLIPVGAQELGSYYPVLPQQEIGEEERLDLRSIWAALYRNRWLIIGLVTAGVVAGLVVALLSAPIYRATTSVQIEQQTARILESEDVEPMAQSGEADRFLQTQVDIIESRSLAQRVAQQLNLAEKPQVIQALGIDAQENARPHVLQGQIVDALRNGLSVDLPRNTRIAAIRFDSRDPQASALISNAFAENFIRANLQRRFDTSAYSREFLQGQLQETKNRLEQSERQLIEYARSARLIDASTGIVGDSGAAGPRSLTTSNLVELNQAYAQARAARVQAQQRWSQAQGAAIMSLPEVLSNPTIQQLTQRRSELQAQYEEQTQRRQPEHPEVQQLSARIRETQSQIDSLAASIRSSIREQYEVAASQERALQGNVGQLQGATLAEQDRSVRYNILRREVDTARQMYEGLLQRYREVSAASGITANNIAVIDRADAPGGPIWPRPLLNIFLGGAGALALALMFVFLREIWDDSVHTPDDVERKLKLPLLGIVPRLAKGETVQDAFANPRSAMSEAYSAVRTALELSAEGGLPRSIMVTSSRQAEGKSTTAFGIARDLAVSGKNVLLIDADLRKPSLHRLLATDHDVGLSNFLARQVSAEDAIRDTGIDHLFFMSSGPLPPNPAQLLGGATLQQRLEQLLEVFDYIIIDAPPVLGLADTLRLSTSVAATVYVVEARGAHRGQARGALARLNKGRVVVLGAVLTKFDARRSGYGYGYGYGYHYDYGLPDQKTRRLTADQDD